MAQEEETPLPSPPLTPYRQVLAALAESEARYQALVEGVRRYAIFRLSPAGTVLTWNQGVKELLGYEREEFIGQSGSICFVPEDRAAGRLEAELAEATRLREAVMDCSGLHKDGTIFGVRDIVTALHDEAGTPLGFVKVTREVVAQRFTTTQAAAEQLAATDAELTATLALLHTEAERRRRLEANLLTAIEEERRRLGQDLHEGLGQHLAGIGLLARALTARIAKSAPAESEGSQLIAELIEDAIGVARELTRGLQPVSLSSQGLPAAFAELAHGMPPSVEFSWSQCKRLELEPAVALHVYRIAEEAVGNALRHSGATRIGIELAVRALAGQATMSIRDNGRGFVAGAATEGMGVRNMRYRAGVIAGTLSLVTQPGQGSCVSCTLPLPGSESQRQAPTR